MYVNPNGSHSLAPIEAALEKTKKKKSVNFGSPRLLAIFLRVYL
jgi:hypothetical protein